MLAVSPGRVGQVGSAGPGLGGGKVPGVFYNSPSARARLRALREKVEANAGRARVFGAHDSTMYGQGAGTGLNASVGAFDKSILAKAAAELNAMGIPALAEGQIGDGGRYSTMIDYNPRWKTLGAGWSGGTDLALGGYAIRNNSDTSAIVYEPLVAVDAFDVIYARNASQANFDLSINGGAGTTINPTGGAAVLTATKTASKGTLALSIARSGASGHSRILGVIPYDSSVSAFDLVMAAIPGAASSRINGSLSQSLSPLPALQQLKPDILLSLVGINDMRAPVSIATSRNNMQTTLNAISADTDMICIAPNRFLDGSVPEATQDEWRAMLFDFCGANGITLIDPTIHYRTYALMLAAGLMGDVITHPNEIWTGMVGLLFAQAIKAA